ncbi:MAG: UDP-N-acetylmuramoyl-L-alanyl-D-glutamate--2,6-diaminopimelate ligase [Holosporales bacterium]|nr:UDP-N-acetylmuramoyl-L-alanyl-D-glutamate--2,6-diaminopimelate ligase [Holosporales bacterium]
MERFRTLHKAVSIISDSRKVTPGCAFVAIPCEDVDLHVKEALEKGAIIVIREGKGKFSEKTLYVRNARKSLAKLSSDFFEERPEVLLGVTGTNGKSSVVSFVSQILGLFNIKTASIGTLGVNVLNSTFQINDSLDPGFKNMTTYDPFIFHRILRDLSKSDFKCAAIEATSHGLHQYRLDGVKFDAVALTNITQDHLDYHKTMARYVAAKGRLFSELAKDCAVAVLNKKSNFLEFFKKKSEKLKLKVIFFAIDEDTDICATNIIQNEKGTNFDLKVFNQIFKNVSFKVNGRFQIENLLCAIGLISVKYPQVIKRIDDVIPHLDTVPGRLEFVGMHNGGKVFVDFSHTPDALEKVLGELRGQNPNNLIVVFGCGGQRDVKKRPIMGEIAFRLADQVIITDDNPRSEDPEKIRKDILSGVIDMAKVVEIPGRDKAVKEALTYVGEKDILLVTGRGHEEFQKIGNTEIPFNDVEFIKKNISLKKSLTMM